MGRTVSVVIGCLGGCGGRGEGFTGFALVSHEGCRRPTQAFRVEFDAATCLSDDTFEFIFDLVPVSVPDRCPPVGAISHS